MVVALVVAPGRAARRLPPDPPRGPKTLDGPLPPGRVRPDGPLLRGTRRRAVVAGAPSTAVGHPRAARPAHGARAQVEDVLFAVALADDHARHCQRALLTSRY